MKTLRWFGRLSLLTFGLVVAGNVVVPAVARAQFAASGGASVSQVVAALVGQDVTAARFTATAGTGTGHACNSTLASCVDLGPGAHNSLGTNLSGHVLLGPENDASTVVRIGDTLTLYGNGTILGTNAALVLNNNGFIVNQTGTKPVLIDDAQGLRLACQSSLPTCGTDVLEGTVLPICATGGVDTKPCLCTSDGGGTPAYAWRHLGTWTLGTSTTCTP